MGRFFQIAFGLALLAVTVYTSLENIRYAREALVTTGTVVAVTNRVEVQQDSLSFTQSPVVEFTPIGGKDKRRFRSSIWTSALFAPKTGERIAVEYLENEPEGARIDTWMNWCLPLLLAVVGVATILGKTTSGSPGWGFRWTSD